MTEAVISVATFAYPNVSTRERSVLASVLIDAPSTNAFVLDTCLRLEVAVSGDPSDLDRVVEQLFGKACPAPGMHVRSGVDAIHHLYRVAAGLESPVLGEREILTQFRGALNKEKHRFEGMFLKILEQAVQVGRKARELLPARPHESMAAVAAQVVGAADRVAVLGSGVMAIAVGQALKQLPSPPAITIVARHPERVAVEDVDVLSFDAIRRVLATFPAVISATSAKTRLLDPAQLCELLDARSRQPTLVDMAMPPDFSLPHDARVEYIDIDNLAVRAARGLRSDAADGYVAEAASAVFRRVVEHRDVAPVIRHMIMRADDLVDQAVARFAGRLTDDGDEEVLRQAVHTVARTMLADPVTFVKQADADSVSAIARAFGFDE